MNKKIKILIGILLIAATVGWLCFIFANSLKTAEESSAQSSTVCQIIQSTTEAIGLKVKIKEAFVRNLAHFAEFAILNVLFCADLLYFFIIPKKLKMPYLSLSLAASLLMAFIDELIQKFTDGRAADILDVLVDFCGALTGALAVSLILLVIFLIRRRAARHTD